MRSINRLQYIMCRGAISIVVKKSFMSRTRLFIYDNFATWCQQPQPRTLLLQTRGPFLPEHPISCGMKPCLFSSRSSETMHIPLWMVALKKIGNHSESLSEEFMSKMKNKMNYLERLGCKNYQILEGPKLLELSHTQLSTLREQLSTCGIPEVSVPLLALAQRHPKNQLKAAVTEYMCRLDGCVSVADFWCQRLHITNEKILHLINSNPRLIASSKNIKEKMLKLELLMEYGLRGSEIAQSSYVLSNQPVHTLKKRLDQLRELNIQPVPLVAISQAGHVYEKYIKSVIQKQKVEARRWPVLSGLLGQHAKSLAKYPILRTTALSSLEGRISYLLSERNYSPEDILECPGILDRKSIHRLRKAFDELDGLGLDQLPLDSVVSFLMYKKVPTSKKNGSQKSLFKILECDAWRVAEVDPAQYAALFSQKPSIIKKNLAFLIDNCFFQKEVVLDLPIILGHDHNILVNQWEKLCRENDPVTERLIKEPRKLLNLLQYYIEREANFKHPILAQNHEVEQ